MRVGVSLPVREMRDDLGAIREFAVRADELGFRHLRVPDLVLRADGGHLHEPLMLLAFLAAVTSRIELVPSVVVLPSRQTVLFAKQAAELDILSNGRFTPRRRGGCERRGIRGAWPGLQPPWPTLRRAVGAVAALVERTSGDVRRGVRSGRWRGTRSATDTASDSGLDRRARHAQRAHHRTYRSRGRWLVRTV